MTSPQLLCLPQEINVPLQHLQTKLRPHLTDGAYCCYLLEALNHKKIYIGSTNNPYRRLRQHNGLIKGGAKYTARFKPWKMTHLVLGFDNPSEALSFEWHWQRYPKSRRKIKVAKSALNRVQDLLRKNPQLRLVEIDSLDLTN